jgi:hypothetical protein
LNPSTWSDVHATFVTTSEESGGHWKVHKHMDDQWEMKYSLERPVSDLRFSVMTTPGRHLGVFPETASLGLAGGLIHPMGR